MSIINKLWCQGNPKHQHNVKRYIHLLSHSKKLVLGILITPCLLMNSNIYADDHNLAISQLKSSISELNNKLSEIELDIKNTDTQIAQKSIALNNINKNIVEINSKQEALENEKRKNTVDLDKQKKILVQQLESMYILHRSKDNHNINNINQINNITQLNRYLNYLKTYNDFHLDNINTILQTTNKLAALDQNLKSLEQQQIKLKQKISNSYQELTLLKVNNQRLKQDLEQALSNKLAKLNYHREQQQKLDHIILSSNKKNKSAIINKNIKQQLSDLFLRAKGKLPMPVAGEISSTFSNKKSNQSIFINTKEGLDVTAIFSGKVVFSNWLRGFGFITIIDHGSGYMSLYGNNQALLKKTDDFVEAGEVIALTGSSGGINSTGLYFEIRHNGTSIDTLAWLNSNQSPILAKL